MTTTALPMPTLRHDRSAVTDAYGNARLPASGPRRRAASGSTGSRTAGSATSTSTSPKPASCAASTATWANGSTGR